MSKCKPRPLAEEALDHALDSLGSLGGKEREQAKGDVEALFAQIQELRRIDEIDLPARRDRTNALRDLSNALKRAARCLESLPPGDLLHMDIAKTRPTQNPETLAADWRDLARAASMAEQWVPDPKGSRPKSIARPVFGERALQIFETYTKRRATATEDGSFVEFLEALMIAAGVEWDARSVAQSACRARDEQRGLFAYVQ